MAKPSTTRICSRGSLMQPMRRVGTGAANGSPPSPVLPFWHRCPSSAIPSRLKTTPARQPGMLKREEVIALWSQVSGRSAEGVEWHEIAQIGKISAIIAEGTNMYVTGRSTDPKLAYFMKNREYYLGVMRAMLDGGGF